MADTATFFSSLCSIMSTLHSFLRSILLFNLSVLTLKPSPCNVVERELSPWLNAGAISATLNPIPPAIPVSLLPSVLETTNLCRPLIPQLNPRMPSCRSSLHPLLNPSPLQVFEFVCSKFFTGVTLNCLKPLKKPYQRSIFNVRILVRSDVFQ